MKKRDDKPRGLELICTTDPDGKGFSREILGLTYWRLSVNKQNQCSYMHFAKDHNDLYQCIYYTRKKNLAN